MKINEILREQIKNEIPRNRCCLVTALKVALRLYGTLHITGRGFMVEFKMLINECMVCVLFVS